VTLTVDCQVLLAPRFPPIADWSRRLRLSAGVTIQGDHAFPREPWRSPTTEELAVLVREPARPLTQVDFDASLSLLTLPRHLLDSWWELLAQAGPEGIPGFAGFLRDLSDFLAFKELLPPAGLSAEVVACPPERTYLRGGPDTNEPAGLGWSAGLWGLFNLGAEALEVVFLPRRVGDPAGAAELLTSEPDSPLVALRLEAGDGCRLPVAGLLLDGQATEPTLNLWLLVQPNELP
jgi:hypothetical protein